MLKEPPPLHSSPTPYSRTGGVKIAPTHSRVSSVRPTGGAPPAMNEKNTVFSPYTPTPSHPYTESVS
ncbi:MAG: hypothetical protein DSM106950_19775 [Stigonema ocellatum SAG 48.90 = DSM 106950]|nr:hypothetical protein [Stigonema ocellatum SAG 48.90 = DSM 106950]